MPSDAKAKRAANKSAKQQAAAIKGGAVASDADAASESSTETAASKRIVQEKQAFFERTGKNAAARKNMNMDISVTDITLYAGEVGGPGSGLELIDRGVLALTYGRNYGMVGRNGVGKSTLLRAIACRFIPVPEMFNVVHVEQECTGDGRTALESVVQADQEREWLLKLEKDLVDEAVEEEEIGITLNEVYERLEQLDSDGAEARAAMILSGLGFDQEMMNKKTNVCLCVCMLMYVFMCLFTRVFMCGCVRVYLCVSVCASAYVYILVCKCVYTCVLCLHLCV